MTGASFDITVDLVVAAVADALLSGSVGMITIQTSSTSWILFQTSQFHCLHFFGGNSNSDCACVPKTHIERRILRIILTI